jgi:hypothetical protein
MHSHGAEEVAVGNQAVDIVLTEPRVIERPLDGFELQPIVAPVGSSSDTGLTHSDNRIPVF